MSPAPAPQAAVELVPLRWWHLRSVMELEHDLFGAEQWSEESFWSELAYCPPMLVDGPFRRYWAAVPARDSRVDAVPPAVLGYAGVAVTSDEAYVQTIGVAVPTQRRGVGRRLLQQLLDDARDAGGRTCWLEVRADNTVAQAMYARFGFSPRGRRRGYYQPSGTDAIVMSVQLQRRTEEL
jgi:[ribosomal protein S18]-alanine N-acetyltransferase